MPARDMTRWEENEDGSYSRRYVEPVATADAVDATADVVDATAGAVEAADELGVDLATVTGTGAEGRITKADVEAAANKEE